MICLVCCRSFFSSVTPWISEDLGESSFLLSLCYGDVLSAESSAPPLWLYHLEGVGSGLLSTFSLTFGSVYPALNYCPKLAWVWSLGSQLNRGKLVPSLGFCKGESSYFSFTLSPSHCQGDCSCF